MTRPASKRVKVWVSREPWIDMENDGAHMWDGIKPRLNRDKTEYVSGFDNGGSNAYRVDFLTRLLKPGEVRAFELVPARERRKR